MPLTLASDVADKNMGKLASCTPMSSMWDWKNFFRVLQMCIAGAVSHHRQLAVADRRQGELGGMRWD